jgi:hypothetical protein
MGCEQIACTQNGTTACQASIIAQQASMAIETIEAAKNSSQKYS